MRWVKPDVLWLDEANVVPLLRAIAADPIGGPTLTICVGSDEAFPARSLLSDLSDVFPSARVVPVPRSDASLFLPWPCSADPCSRRLHVSQNDYVVEVLSSDSVVADEGMGALVVTSRFLWTTPVIRFLTEMIGTVETRTCECGHVGYTVTVEE